MSFKVEAGDLNAVELYRRCFAQLTQNQFPVNDSVYLQVKANKKNPITACLELVDKAKLVKVKDGYRLSNPKDFLAVTVLNTMYQLHQTFFMNKTLDFLGSQSGFFDEAEPALFYTLALFGPSTKVSSILTLDSNLVADRTENNPKLSSDGYFLSDLSQPSTANLIWASKGNLIGVVNNKKITLVTNEDIKRKVDLFTSRGGGIIGTPTYLMESVQENFIFKADSFKIPRKWAKAVFSDFLCRYLPVVNYEDAKTYVVNDSAAHAFRRSESCTLCHASMDRMAAVNRNFKYDQYFLTSSTYPTTITKGGTDWPAVVTENYSSQPTNGVLYFRNYKGNLVNQTVTSIKDLGAKITNQDDFFICAAKRYYQYFTGVDVDVFNPQDSRFRNKGTDMQKHQQNVVKLGLDLKKHQSLKTLIKDILNLPVYKSSNLGITNN
jgi:hypothetical protein